MALQAVDEGDGASEAFSDSASVVSSTSSRVSRLSQASTGSTVSRAWAQSMDCQYGASCYNGECAFRHPAGWSACPEGVGCSDYNCKQVHPPARKKCFFGTKCIHMDCPNVHPAGRQRPCPAEEDCDDFDCQLVHPGTRAPRCVFGASCESRSCSALHPESRVLQGDGDSDPEDGGSRPVRGAAAPRAPQGPRLRTFAERQELRAKQQLPIFLKRQEFLDRLAAERVLVAIAETGSGKTTQLPQYAAEDPRLVGPGPRPKLVVCTQPRGFAASMIAKRVATEFDGDGIATGHSVGFMAGGKRATAPGRSIVFTTDATLIKMAQDDELLSKVGVLIIDEAHERSLNTDVVLGIAKRILAKRPGDFFVVISSATINADPFLTFYGRPVGTKLEASGRMYKVDVDYRPPARDSSANSFNDEVRSHVVPEVISAMTRFGEGHALVFLPGQKEIELAISEFRNTCPDSMQVVALPLYGSLPPEDQELVTTFHSQNAGSGRRMVAFCTNMAETSLTIDGVRVVIDTGYAKEARFDPKRRLTVIELTRIAQSSADQRKGRAGRTAEGNCVRLFPKDALKRPAIEPEILRSSLDQVVLQIFCLGLDPATFPFLDPPPAEALAQACSTLRMIGCVDQDGRITPRGRMFSDLPFEPRLSAFVEAMRTSSTDPTLSKARLALGCDVAALLSAPGLIHFMGGKEGRKERQQAVARDAMKFDSDLLFQASVLRGWRAAGLAADGTTAGPCRGCGRKLPRGGCLRCRGAYARTNGLNNKVLTAVLESSEDVSKALQKSNRPSHLLRAPDAPVTAEDSLAIGRALLTSYGDQLAEMMMASNPQAGIHMHGPDIRASITATSAVAQKAGPSSSSSAASSSSSFNSKRYLVVMNVTQLPHGGYMAETIHPVSEDTVLASGVPTHKSRDICCVVFLENLGKMLQGAVRSAVFDVCKRARDSADRDSWGFWAESVVDPQAGTFALVAENKHKGACQVFVARVLNDKREEMLNYEATVLLGSSAVDIRAGGEVLKISKSDSLDRTRVRFVQPPGCSTFAEVKAWLVAVTKVGPKDIRWVSVPRDGKATAAFASEAVAGRAVKVLGALQNEELENTGRAEDRWGREVRAILQATTDDEARRLLASLGYPDVRVDSLDKATKARREREFAVDLFPVPPGWDAETVRTLAAKAGDKQFRGPILLRESKKLHGNGFLQSAKLIAASPEEQAQVVASLQELAPAALIGANIAMAPKVTALAQGGRVQVSAPFVITFKDQDTADRFWQQQQQQQLGAAVSKVSSSVRVSVHNHRAFGDLGALASRCAEVAPGIMAKVAPRKTGASAAGRRDDGNDVDVTFSSEGGGAVPSQLAVAAHKLSNATKPAVIHLSSREQQRFFSELAEGEGGGWLQLEGRRRGMIVEVFRSERDKRMVSRLRIYGASTSLGPLMAEVGERFDGFQYSNNTGRYTEVPVPATMRRMFGDRSASAAQGLFKELVDSWKSRGVLVAYLFDRSAIEVYTHVRTANIHPCVEEVKGLLRELGSAGDSDRSSSAHKCCVFCSGGRGATPLENLMICGHPFHDSCLEAVISEATGVPIRCRRCETPVHSKELTADKNQGAALSLVRWGAVEYLKAKGAGFKICPNSRAGCGNLSLSETYGACAECKAMVCGRCGTVGNPLHESRTCEDTKRLGSVHGVLDELYRGAKDFVDKNWDPSLESLRPVLVQSIPTVADGTANSVRRFLAGAKALGISLNFSSSTGHYAWHGTGTDEAVVAICENGFDPTRRRGQACGPGEYFGVRAGVSHSPYAGDTGRLIVAFLLRGSHHSTREGFCYVINNALDWMTSFCLPVAVVDYKPGRRPLAFAPSKGAIDPTAMGTEDLSVEVLPKDAWKAPFRWHWQDDRGNFEPYTDTINHMLEQYYDQHRHGHGPAEVLTPPIVRYVDDRPQAYRIDLINMRQTNNATGFTRGIKRVQMPEDRASGDWQWLDDGHNWVRWEALARPVLDAAYTQYRDGAGSATVTLRFPGRPESYTIDFSKGQQTNSATGTKRAIRRG